MTTIPSAGRDTTAGAGEDHINYVHSEREAIVELFTRTADRAESETRIKDEYERASTGLREQYAERRRSLDDTYKSQTRQVKQIYEQTIRKAHENYAELSQEIDGVAATVRSELADKAAHSSHKAREGLQDGVWSAETVYEAREHQPREQFEQIKSRADGALDDIRAALDEARAWFRRCHQPFPRLDSSQPAASTASEGQNIVDEHAVPEAIEACADDARAELATMRTLRLPRLFIGIVPFVLFAAAAGVGAGIGIALDGWTWASNATWATGIAAGVGLLLLLIIHAIARAALRSHVAAMHFQLETAVPLHARCIEVAQQQRTQSERELIEQRDKDIALAKERFEPILVEVERRHADRLRSVEEKYNRRMQRITSDRDAAIAGAEQEYQQLSSTLEKEYTTASDELEAWHSGEHARIEAEHTQQWQALTRRWHDGVKHAWSLIERLQEEHDRTYMPWDDPRWQNWSPPEHVSPIVRFGTFQLDMAQMPGGLPTDPRLALSRRTACQLPALIELPNDAALLLESRADGRTRALETLQTIMARLLTTVPPGKVRFTIIDPVALGQNFAGFMHLADYEGALVSERIWTETQHIEQRLADLTEHMENVIQKYLRNEFETIADYNVRAGEIAEPYRFLIVADFPTNFTDEAARRLMSIINSGARCGVYTLIHFDARRPLPRGIEPADLARNSAHLTIDNDRCAWNDDAFGRLPLQLDPVSDEQTLTQLMHAVGTYARDSTHVEVPFDVIAPHEGDIWSLSTRDTIYVPLGRSGATKLQYLELGRGTAQHALVAGKTGSGKSTLLHVLITNLALWYSPDEVEMYLVDFKKGVEFKTYATHRLPHARVIAIESDREFGLSVLQKLDAELRHRGNIFRDLGIQNLAGYRDLDRDDPMPRILLVIDEFQEFFIEDDKIAQDASLLLDRLVRQGRAFGIHVLLGSQTLGGAYSLARTTLNQMAVRIALQCSESDSYLILNEDNAAARLLSRPGEALYNDASGMVEGNNPFQIVWLPEATRDQKLRAIRQRKTATSARRDATQIVFEGNVPANIERNDRLVQLLTRSDWPTAPSRALAWLGEAISIKEPTAASFQRHSGSNLLMIGQRDEAALAMFASSILSLALQHPARGASFLIMDGRSSDDPQQHIFPLLQSIVPHEIDLVEHRAVATQIETLAAIVKQRADVGGSEHTPIFLMIYGLSRYRMLRQQDDFGFSSFSEGSQPSRPDRQFVEILQEGPAVGVHTILWCDTLVNLNRMLERQALREFEMRIMFQMSATDSTTLIDTPQASKLGMRRALFYSEEDGVLEKFRPYALPPESWLAEVGDQLRGRGK